MKIGYARTSTAEQHYGFEDQIEELTKAGCERIFREQVSSVAERAELDKMLEFIRAGDTLIVTKVDRLARSVLRLCEMVEFLQRKGASLVILAFGLDTSTTGGAAMLQMLGVFAEMERKQMLERQKIGIARARTDGKYRGREPTARAKRADVINMKLDGIAPAEIARTLGIARSSVYRIIDDERPAWVAKKSN